jgi:ABC-2 type transport system ATP-binding protein
MEPILRVERVCKQFGDYVALDDVSLEVPRGEVYGLLGPNGAGKTTLIRIINRITAPDSGAVWFNGHPLAPEDVAHIGYLPEERGLYKNMKVGEQAIYFARLKGLSRHDAVAGLKEWFEKFGIEEWWGRRVSELSKGMAQKVQFIVTVLHRPELLIFDEPFSGFDPVNANLLKQEMLALRDRGATIIFSTHNMSSVEEVCNHITLINRSRNILSGRLEDIRRTYGSNVYELRFSGDGSALPKLLGGAVTMLDVEQGRVDAPMRFRLNEGVGIRSVVDIVNSQVDIRSLTEVVPSMNEIFINTVGHKG